MVVQTVNIVPSETVSPVTPESVSHMYPERTPQVDVFLCQTHFADLHCCFFSQQSCANNFQWLEDL